MIEGSLKLLGLAVEDKVTGFKGVVESISFDLYGCIQGFVKPKAENGLVIKDGHWFDVVRLSIREAVPVLTPPAFSSSNKTPGPAEKKDPVKTDR